MRMGKNEIASRMVRYFSARLTMVQRQNIPGIFRHSFHGAALALSACSSA